VRGSGSWIWRKRQEQLGEAEIQADSLPSEPPGSILILSPENQLSLGSGKKETTGKTKQKPK